MRKFIFYLPAATYPILARVRAYLRTLPPSIALILSRRSPFHPFSVRSFSSSGTPVCVSSSTVPPFFSEKVSVTSDWTPGCHVVNRHFHRITAVPRPSSYGESSTFSPSTAPEKRRVPLFADYAEEFWLDYSPHWKPATQRSSRSRIDQLLVPRFGDLPVDMIERGDINRWRDSMAERGGSFNRAIPIMSVMMQYAEKLGYRAKNTNPCRGVSRFKRDLPERYLSADEYRRLGRVLAEHDGVNPFVIPALLMLIYTGARVSEIATLRWRYVQPPRLQLPDSKTGPKTIYLNPQAIAVLDGLERRGDELLVFPAMRREAPINLGQYWDRIRRKAALPEVRLHDLRHSFASVAITQHIPLAIIGKLLGHALPETTARYAHLADEVISESADRICSTLAHSMGMTS